MNEANGKTMSRSQDIEVTGASDEDAAKLRAISTVWIESYLSGDLERFVGLMHEDIVVMAEGQRTVRGIDDARAYFAGRVGQPGVRFIDRLREIRVHGDWAYFLGDFVFESDGDGDGQDAFRHHGRYFVLYEKNAEGEWKMLRDMDNAMPAG